MNLRGPCSGCGTPLEVDQRYCVECGTRVGPALSLPYPPATRSPSAGGRLSLPMPLRLAVTLALTAVGFGVVVGTAMSTVLDDEAAMPPPHVAQAALPQSPEPPATPASGANLAPGLSTPPSDAALGSPYIPGLSPGTGAIGKTVEPKPQMISGTVVHVNRVAGSYAVSQGAGSLVAIHAKKLPEAGAKVNTPVRQLLNGTYAEDGKRKTKGRRDRATFTGTVTFRDDEPGKDFYTVSSPGSSVLVRMTPDAAGVATPPGFGTAVTVTTRFDPYTPPAPGATPPTPPSSPAATACDTDGEAVPVTPATMPTLVLTQVDLKVDQQSVTSGNLEGIVQAVCPGSRQLVLSADDMRESGRDVVIAAPEGIDVDKVHVGGAIVGSVELKQSDMLSLGGLASDQGIKGADSQKQLQGTL